jgi:hypothetical protein
MAPTNAEKQGRWREKRKAWPNKQEHKAGLAKLTSSAEGGDEGQ